MPPFFEYFFPAFQKNLCHEPKLISPKATVLWRFPASSKGILWFNHNIQQIPGFSVQNRMDIPILFQQAAPASHSLALWRTVTAYVPVLSPCSERYTIKQVFWLVELMWNRGISPQITQYSQGRKVCRLKGLCWKAHNLCGHRPAKPGGKSIILWFYMLLQTHVCSKIFYMLL